MSEAIEELEELEQAVDFVTSPTDKLEEMILANGFENLPPTNFFSDGIYIRSVTMLAKNPLVLGHKHNTRHFNIVLTGSALVAIEGEVFHVKAPVMFESKEGVRKSLYILEDMTWLTVHPNPEGEQDNGKLEEIFVTKSDAFNEHQNELEVFKEALNQIGQEEQK